MLKRFIVVLLAAFTLLCFVCCSDDEETDTPAEETVEAPVTTQPVTQEKKWKIPEDIELTETQREAAESAEEHLNGAGVSRATLFNVLIDEGHSTEDAEFAIDIFEIDWKEMARGTAEFYTYYMPFSYQGIKDHLLYMSFTEEEAQYGADSVEVDWDSMATKYIEKYYLYDSFGQDGVIEELEKAGFTHDQAVKGLEEYETKRAEDSSLRESLGLD